MKLNFWQWLGLLLLAIGVAMYLYKKSRPASSTTPADHAQTAPVVQPTR